MDQLWCYIYTCTKDPLLDMIRHATHVDIKRIRKLLKRLYTGGVDWTDPSAWPEDYVNGRWKRQNPISFLLENSGPRVAACIGVINAICSGGFCSLASAKRSGLSCSSSDPCMPVEVRSVRAFLACLATLHDLAPAR